MSRGGEHIANDGEHENVAVGVYYRRVLGAEDLVGRLSAGTTSAVVSARGHSGCSRRAGVDGWEPEVVCGFWYDASRWCSDG
jgi:hypothetical protein